MTDRFTPQVTLSASGTYSLIPVGVPYGRDGYQVRVTGSGWTGSLVFVENQAPPGSAANYVNVAYQNANTGLQVAAGTAITADGTFIVPVRGYDVAVQYTHTSGSVTLSVSPAHGINRDEAEDVGFARLGSGTFERTAQDKLAEQPSVTDFGAVGDGVTDDYAALARAATALGATNRLFFPPGTYRVGTNLIINCEAIFALGATLEPDSGVTVTLAGPVTTAPGASIIASTALGTVSITGAVNGSGVLDVRTFGAVGDGVTDDTAAIASAISRGIAAFPGGVVIYFPRGVYVSDTITIPSKVTLKGDATQDGWARLSPATYEMASVIKLKDSADDVLIRVAGATQLWGIQDLVLDGNKDNQSSYGSHCIKTETAASRNFGGSIKGVRCVNPKGWGGFFTGGPLNITDTFFMSGAVFVRVSDLKIANVDFDGTDGLHPSLTVARTTTATVTNSFVFGWGEVAPLVDAQNVSGTINGDSTITVTAGSYLYEDAPVVPVGATVSGANSNAVYFAHQVSSDTWELYTAPFAAAAFSPAKVTFSPASGGVDLWHGGQNEASYWSYCYGNSFSGGRFAGAKWSGIRMVECDQNSVAAVQFYNNNLAGAADESSVHLTNSDANAFTACQLGEQPSLGARDVDHAIWVDGTSQSNKFDASNYYIGTDTPIVVLDDAGNTYRNRNLYAGVIGFQDAGTQRLDSPINLNEPLVHFAAYTVTTDTTVAAATNGVVIPLTARKQSGMSESGDAISFNAVTDSVYEVSGQFGITGYDATTTYVLIKLLAINAALGSTEYRTAVPIASTAGTILSVPFNFKMYCSADCSNTLRFEVFQPASGGTFQVVADARYSLVTVQKMADLSA